jgi:amino acid transporter
MATLFFGYAGFESLAQTAGETRDPRRTLPRVFLNGILISVTIYVLIAFVAFGVLPYQQLAASDSAMADVASVYLPVGGAAIVALGALMAFTTSINGSILVPSRTLFVFAEDRMIPEFKFLRHQAERWEKRVKRGGSSLWLVGARIFRGLGAFLNLAAVSERFGTPHMSLVLCLGVSLLMIWTETIDYMLNVALQGVFTLYVVHGAALICLPFVRPELYKTARIRFNPPFLILCSLFSMGSIIWFSKELFTNDTRVLGLIGLWVAVGTVLYWIARWEGRKDGFDYQKRLVEEWQDTDNTIPTSGIMTGSNG